MKGEEKIGGREGKDWRKGRKKDADVA